MSRPDGDAAEPAGGPGATPPRGATVLVTGATGFIGARVAARARAAGYRVRALARDPEAARRLSLLARVEVVGGDVTDPASLAGIEEGVDIVVHAAGTLGKWRTPAGELHRVNVQGAVNVLERFAGRAVRYLHLSAGGVTGPVPAKCVDETHPCRPATDYERTKLAAEEQVLGRAPQLGVAATVVRPTFTYGPGDPHKLALFRAVKKGRYAFIGRGDSVVTPVFVDELVGGILLAMERAPANEVILLGGARPVSKKELVLAIAGALGIRRRWLHLPRWVAWPAAVALEGAGRLGGFEPILTRSRVMMMADNFGYSSEKARRLLGYQPLVELSEGIARTVAAYRAEGLLLSAARRLIVHADDFGLSAAVNRGIVQAWREGVLTSTTMLVNLGGFAEAVALAKANPGMAVGVHLSLLWGAPVLPAAEVPSLVDAAGQFPTSLTVLARRYFSGRLDLAQVRRELSAQLARFRDGGLTPTHVDSHKHVHCLPGVMAQVAAVCREHGVARVRWPREGGWLRRAPGRTTRGAMKAALVRWLARGHGRILGAHGLRSPDHFAGISFPVSVASLRWLLAAMPAGTTELMCHAGYNDAEAVRFSRRPPSRDTETAALVAPEVAAAVRDAGVELISYREL